ncbi:T9SS type A sorting domain-containing protein [Gelidibacter sp.]|uniref:T9SS type A sorting domain-containing protein n=1 Tax=Gelidibacter sp. TaxID=2018083 RepID=UPI002BAED5D6|nr:T9SS type A sorting domain-containing protein [Gelidibacter sp.]HUH29036.1 T9SS type A sorting domain-containing protein [Gelidibacter sp.]
MKKITLLFLLSIQMLFAQNYTEYLTGNATDVTTNHKSGICLMGGAADQDDALKWFLSQTDGGDVVVLRTTGDDGYNNYFYTTLGVTINSVRTFVIEDALAAIDPYILEKVANAEAIWIAGGDQYDYVKYFKDNAMEDALNSFINTKKGVIGGTSAGMAILGSSYFTAQYGSITSPEALSNPYHARATIGYDDFLEIPFMTDVITDSHFANRDREGRMSVFMGRHTADHNRRSFGIACSERTAITVDVNGKAAVYGSESAYFLQSNCVANNTPETIEKFKPFTWNRGGEAIKVYKVQGTGTGTNYFDLSDWETGSGGTWENWSVNAGVFAAVAGTNPMCGTLSTPAFESLYVEIYPNPTSDRLFVKSKNPIKSVKVYNVLGKEFSVSPFNNEMIDVSSLSSGLYILKLFSETSEQTFKFIRK